MVQAVTAVEAGAKSPANCDNFRGQAIPAGLRRWQGMTPTGDEHSPRSSRTTATLGGKKQTAYTK
jgi:hypothetical protein